MTTFDIENIIMGSELVNPSIRVAVAFRVSSKTGKRTKLYAATKVKGSPRTAQEAVELLYETPKVTWRTPTTDKDDDVQLRVGKVMEGARAACIVAYRGRLDFPVAMTVESIREHLAACGVVLDCDPTNERHSAMEAALVGERV